MTSLKRMFWFLLINFVIIFTISIILHILGIDDYITASGTVDYNAMLIFCLAWGMIGSFISLLLSKFIIKRTMRVKVVDPNTSNYEEQQLVQIVHKLATSASLPKMPEVGIYPSDEVNAFATGPSKSNSLVAVSSALLERMNKNQLEGVLSHEIAHIANGDMVTMTLLQGVINAFVMFFARVLAFAISSALSKDSDSRRSNSGLTFLLVIVFQVVFGILGSMVLAYFSRIREFRADKGGATYGGTPNMISALESLKELIYTIPENKPQQQESYSCLKISDKPSKFMALFSTHPPLDVRIERLKKTI